MSQNKEVSEGCRRGTISSKKVENKLKERQSHSLNANKNNNNMN